MIVTRRKPEFESAEVPQPRMDIREVEKAYARLFATTDGKKVLAHLNAVTFMRTAGIDAPDNLLRHMEGQRALLASMLRLIERGRN
ncbi:MAG TPA: hypothetical protein VL625_02085 [Patescibacteria group bacterium]|nr:hypothetical protein [Patescibacteria group bacterium]